MKANSYQITREIISKHRDEIEGNIVEFLFEYIKEEAHLFEFLTSNEIEYFKEDDKTGNTIFGEVLDFFYDNYDYDISQF